MITDNGKLVADVSSFQADSYPNEPNVYAKKHYALGVRGLMIKLTQGYPGMSAYENPYAAKQFRAFRDVMAKHGHKDPHIGFYNYLYGHDGAASARYFLAWLKYFRMDKNTAIALDVEDSSLFGNLNFEVNQWLKTVREAGYKNVSVYSMSAWFYLKLNPADINTNNFWVADYSSSAPALVRNHYYHTAWQFSDSYHGLGDMSLDYNHILIPGVSTKPKDKKTAEKPKKANKDKFKKPAKYPAYSGEFQADNDLAVFSDSHLKKRYAEPLTKGTIFYALPVKNGKSVSLMLRSGNFVTGNFKYVRQIQVM